MLKVQERRQRSRTLDLHDELEDYLTILSNINNENDINSNNHNIYIDSSSSKYYKSSSSSSNRKLNDTEKHAKRLLHTITSDQSTIDPSIKIAANKVLTALHLKYSTNKERFLKLYLDLSSSYEYNKHLSIEQNLDSSTKRFGSLQELINGINRVSPSARPCDINVFSSVLYNEFNHIDFGLLFALLRLYEPDRLLQVNYSDTSTANTGKNQDKIINRYAASNGKDNNLPVGMDYHPVLHIPVHSSSNAESRPKSLGILDKIKSKKDVIDYAITSMGNQIHKEGTVSNSRVAPFLRYWHEIENKTTGHQQESVELSGTLSSPKKRKIVYFPQEDPTTSDSMTPVESSKRKRSFLKELYNVNNPLRSVIDVETTAASASVDTVGIIKEQTSLLIGSDTSDPNTPYTATAGGTVRFPRKKSQPEKDQIVESPSRRGLRSVAFYHDSNDSASVCLGKTSSSDTARGADVKKKLLKDANNVSMQQVFSAPASADVPTSAVVCVPEYQSMAGVFRMDPLVAAAVPKARIYHASDTAAIKSISNSTNGSIVSRNKSHRLLSSTTTDSVKALLQ